MKHRRHPNFPSYRFYSDRRIMNKTTNRFIKVKPHMKLIDAEGKRKSITSDKLFSNYFLICILGSHIRPYVLKP